MARLPAIITVEADHVVNVNKVFEVIGHGADTVSVPCVDIDDATATHMTPATHYYAQDMGAEDSDVAVWQAMCSGDLPGGPTWGENGVISSQDAQAALVHMTVASEAGLDSPEKVQAFLDGILLGKRLKKRPEPTGGGMG